MAFASYSDLNGDRPTRVLLKTPFTIYHSPFTSELYSKTAAQGEFERVHLARVRLVVVPAQVQEPVQNQLRHLALEVQPVLRRLPRRLLRGDNHVAQTRPLALLELLLPRRERQHVRRPTLPPPTFIEFPHRPVRHERQGRAR